MSKEISYTIPLRRDFIKVPRYYRAKRAINAIKRYIIKHTKVEDVRIGKHLNEHIWSRGIRNPPGKVTVNAIVEEDYVTVELEGKKYEVQKVQTEVVEKATGLKGKIQDAVGAAKGDSDEEEVEEKEETSSKAPTKSNTVDEIKAWLDENKIEYKSSDLKADLLKLVEKNK